MSKYPVILYFILLVSVSRHVTKVSLKLLGIDINHLPPSNVYNESLVASESTIKCQTCNEDGRVV